MFNVQQAITEVWFTMYFWWYASEVVILTTDLKNEGKGILRSFLGRCPVFTKVISRHVPFRYMYKYKVSHPFFTPTCF
jgi:hypothetical protein